MYTRSTAHLLEIPQLLVILVTTGWSRYANRSDSSIGASNWRMRNRVPTMRRNKNAPTTSLVPGSHGGEV
jgi:hypothetical protein